MIGLQNFSATLASQPVLHDISLQANAGEFIAICGPNGAGKTTLLKALAGLLPGTQTRPKTIAYLEQGASCAWGLTVRELVLLGRMPHGDQNPKPVDRALQDCNLMALANRRVDQLSGGQARRALLARALATEPKILLLDEPLADLDPAACHQIMRLLQARAHQGACIIAVLHNIEMAQTYATRMLVMDQGKIVIDTKPVDALAILAQALQMQVGVRNELTLVPPKK